MRKQDIVEANLLLGGSGLISARMDDILTAINLTACGIYLYVATGTVYGASGAVRVGKRWPSPPFCWATDSRCL
jgi:hypothetical protein